MIIAGALAFSNIWINAVEPHVLADASIAAVNGKDGDAQYLNVLHQNKYIPEKVGGVVMMVGIISLLWIMCPKKGEKENIVV
jgi:hypothetical protein